ncbi:SAM-dependent methyltransferase [Nocardia kruczakiae]|uniref:SAM-dependent methyltransferase n=2 Tax=Nocardia kruczakiae TaxID=261477 RepID=A0ABU1XPN4_9NOCA|nr:methyltransferase domain-containing protein [Nocardia kruczakiae]MDR7172513.1 SAM-dependent methyltransferase [Nocardia kruczakiae]
MTRTQIPAQYATGAARTDIERALLAAGKDLDRLRLDDLAMLEDFHTSGRIATGELAGLVEITSAAKVLDAGTGIGGTARYLADRFGCRVTGVDMVEEYCEIARWLDRLVGLDDRIAVRCADVTALPFADGAFQIVFSQHVQMNIADKDGLYREMRRVLVRGGQLALWDITTSGAGEPDYPLPWADSPGFGHLVTPAALRATIEATGFAVERWDDRTDEAVAVMRMVRELPPSPLGLHAFVPEFATRAAHLTDALADGRLRAIRAVARAR